MTKTINPLLIVVLFLSLLITPMAAEQPDQKTVKDIEKLMKKGDEKAQKKEFDKAAELYNQALALNAEYAPLYYGLARINNLEKKYDDSILNLEKAVKIDPNYTPALDLLLKTIMGIGKEKADQRLLEASNKYYLKIPAIPGIETSAKDKLNLANFHIGINYSLLNDPAKANEYLPKVVEFPGLDTTDRMVYVRALYQLSINYFGMNKFNEANQYFARLIQVPDIKVQSLKIYSISLYLLGVVNNELQEYKTSNDYLAQYLELTKENPSDPWAPLATFLVGANNFAMLEKEVAPIKNDPKDKDKATKIAALAKGYSGIQPNLSKAIELKPDLEPAYLQLGNYYYYCQDLDNTIQAYKALIEKFPASQDIESYKKFLEDVLKQKEELAKKK
ncbi:MAG: tetratricopeptide repeat protein [Candidatus Aminicenantes bacterium]|nr:tetratricopeptide repeat protein [Candidatus Aminicenantes bacterium]